jgi:hypothetical protein
MKRGVLLVAFIALTRTGSANVLSVAPGASVQNAINAALPGDEIVLQSGATYTGSLKFPEKGGTLPIIVRSSQPAPERRIGPGDRALLASLGSDSTSPAAAITGNHWHFVGLAFRANYNGEGDIISITGTASDILLDRLLIEGGTSGQKRAVALNGGQTIVTRSHISNIWHTGQDSQALCGWTGPGPFTIRDNFLEAASENVMFGGADSSSADRMPADILVEGNYMTKNLAWKGTSGYNVKNLFELKAARRVTVRNNVFEHNWVDGQSGWGIVITPRNSNGTAPWATVEDVLFENNTIRDTPEGFNIVGYDDEGGPSGQARRLTFRNNLLTNVPGTMLQAGAEVGEITLDHNTSMNAGTLIKMYRGSILQAGGTKRSGQYAVGALTILNSLMVHGPYGIWGESSGIGVPALEYHTLSYDVRRNVIAGENGRQFTYPPDTQQPTMAFYNAQFNTDYTLVNGSPYKSAALDGLDLGVVRAGAFPSPRPPANVLLRH